MTKDKNNLDDLKAQLQQAKKPTGTGAKTKSSHDTDSARRIVDNALQDAKDGKPESINDIVMQSLKRIREQSEAEYINYRGKFKEYGYTATDLNRITKIYKKPRRSVDSEAGIEDSKSTKADMLIALVRTNGVMFHDADDESYVSFKVTDISPETGEEIGEHWETWNLRSKGFKKWASYQFFKEYGTASGESAMTEAIDTLSGIAQFEGEELEIHLRYATNEGIVYIDVGDDQYNVVKIDKTGWTITNTKSLPVKFIRPSSLRPLPLPKKGGNIDLLWENLNLHDTDMRYLIVAYLLEAMLPDRPYPVLEVTGERGSAKSTFQKRLRELIDPNKLNLRPAPRGVENIYITARSSYVVSYNNLSSLSSNTQDALCTLSHGGGDAVRKLYTTAEEEVWEAMRPIMINGIPQLVTQEDLANRVIAVDIPLIETYIDEETLNKKWVEDHPLILGALYELLSKVLKELPNINVEKLPRMADFGRLGQAMLNVLGVDESFTEIYLRNSNNLASRVIESSSVAQAIINMINKEGSFIGTKGALMDRLANYLPTHFDKAAYPKSPRGLADAIRRIAPALRVRNVEIKEIKDDSGRPKRFKDGYRLSIQKIKPTPATHKKTTTIEL